MKAGNLYTKIVIVLIFLPMLAGCGTLWGAITGNTTPSVQSGIPRTFNMAYDMVWDAVLDTVDDNGYVITQMSKTDGYITTGMKESGNWRSKITVRLLRTSEGVRVTINDYSEKLSITGDLRFWRGMGQDGWYQQVLLDEVGSRLKTP